MVNYKAVIGLQENKMKEPKGFRKITLTGSGGKIREVFQPICEEVKAFHEVTKKLLTEDFRWIDIKKTVTPHLSNRFMWKVDLKDAFGSVSHEMAVSVLPEIIISKPEYFFHQGSGLIQGAPSSPIIFERVARNILDRLLLEFIYSEIAGMVYSRYMDDMMFSLPSDIKPWQRKKILKIIRKAGFEINQKKLRLVDNKFQPIEFLGILISNGKTDVTKSFFSKYTHLCLYQRHDWNFKYRFQGMQAWINYVNSLSN